MDRKFREMREKVRNKKKQEKKIIKEGGHINVLFYSTKCWGSLNKPS